MRSSRSAGLTWTVASRSPRRRFGRGLSVVGATTLLMAGLTAAPAYAGSAEHRGDRPVVLDVTASNSPDGNSESYRLSRDQLEAGLINIRLHNAGTVAHQVQLVRLHDGVTPEMYRTQLLASQGGTALVFADAAGGDAAIEPGGFQSSYVNLRAGHYIALCFQQGGDQGAPHFVHGMFSAFTVRGQDEPDRPDGPVRGTISAFSFGFQMPAIVKRNGLYRFRNLATNDTHELQLLKLAPGKTATDVLAWVKNGLTGQPPIVSSAGGGGALAPGRHMWVKLHLTPGKYVAVCFVPDDKAPHLPHAALGMVQGFTAG